MDDGRLSDFIMAVSKKRILSPANILPAVAALLLLAGNYLAEKSYTPVFPPMTELESGELTAGCDMGRQMAAAAL